MTGQRPVTEFRILKLKNIIYTPNWIDNNEFL